ncbi:MAG: hypothetical protein NVSMB23_11700 [Myxococcales bacterium]
MVNRFGWKSATAALGLAALAGCAHGKQQQASVERIDNSSMTRLNDQQMQPVDDARKEEGRARDALARARANEAEAHTRVEVAKAERNVAVAQLNRAKAEHDLLVQQKAAPTDVARASAAQKTSEDRVRATDLKIEYLNRMIGVAQRETRLADLHAQTQGAMVERAKYQALSVADPNQLQGVNGPKIEAQLSSLQAAESAARKEAADKRVEAVDSYNKWQELDARVRTAAVQEMSTPSPMGDAPVQAPATRTPPPPPTAEPKPND